MFDYIKLISLCSDRQVLLKHSDLQLMLDIADHCGWKPQPSQGKDAFEVLDNPDPDGDNDVSDGDARTLAGALNHGTFDPEFGVAVRRMRAVAAAGAFRLVVLRIRTSR